MSDVALAEHALLSDCGSAALVTGTGSVDWLCLPRFDSAPVLARLLDDEAGYFLIAPESPEYRPTWRYLRHGLVLETTWTGPEGELVVTDAMALGAQERSHELGQSAPGALLRQALCTRGSVPVRVEYAPRPEFGAISPKLLTVTGGVEAHGGAGVVVLSTDKPMDIAGSDATMRRTLHEGHGLWFALQQHQATGDASGSPASAAVPVPWKPRQIRNRLAATAATWRSWSAMHQHYQGPLAELVHHSGVVLQGLTFARSGAMVAAATTSLPEGVGSGRTWDYRYTWVRDASLTMQGLFIAACPDEVEGFFDFVAQAATSQLEIGSHLQIMFGVRGERDLAERLLPNLAGWRESGPVRAGNNAYGQLQLDVYGALLDAAYTMRKALHHMPEATRQFLVEAVDSAAALWRSDDQGIWEFRGPARPYLHSKVMCWLALERGLAMSEQLRPGDRAETWARTREEIRAAILSRGWSDKAGAYTQYFGSDELDASALQMAIVGFLPPKDPRLRATVEAIERGLSDQRGLIYRYRGGDGFDSTEGSFLLCTFWLAQALAFMGQFERSEVVLRRAAGYATELGLFSEQVDEVTGELLGNFPQAFSHLGLINAANALAQAERGHMPSPATAPHG
jgi:alpha,alpha-trehalase